MATVEELEKRRAERRAAKHELYEAQKLEDLEARDRLEEELGDGQVLAIEISEATWKPGVVTMALFKLPNATQAKIYKQTITPNKDGSPGDIVKASDVLAAQCCIYPDKDGFAKLLGAFAFVGTNGAVACVKAAEGKQADEGKG